MSNHTPTWSFHTHSEYCDGAGTLRSVVEAGLEAGLTDLGFSSHAPLPWETDWNMPLSRLDRYVSEVESLRREFAGRINLWRGLEIDYVPDVRVMAFQTAEIHSRRFDYYMGSVHFLGRGDRLDALDGTEDRFRTLLIESYDGSVESMVRDYYRRVGALPSVPGVLIISHFDVVKRWNQGNRYFTGNETWYREAVTEALEAIAGSGLLVEVNSAGWRKDLGEAYPAEWILQRCRSLNIPVTVNADSHRPEELTWGYDRALEVLERLNIEPVNPASVLAA